MYPIFEIATNVSTPIMLAGFIAAAFFLILHQILKLNLFPDLNKRMAASLLTLIIDRLFTLTLVALVFGFAGFLALVYLSYYPKVVRPIPPTAWIENREIYQKLRQQGSDGISRMQDVGVAGSAVYYRGVHRDDTMRLLSKLRLDRADSLEQQRELLLKGLRTAANVPPFPDHALLYDSRSGAVPIEQDYKKFLDDLQLAVARHVRE